MKNWTVRSHIILAFSAVVTTMVLLSLFSLMHLRKISSGTESLLRDSLPGFETLAEIRSLSQQQYTILQKHLALPGANQQGQLESQIESLDSQESEAFAKYETTVSTAEEHVLFDNLKAARARFTAASTRIVQAGALPVQGAMIQDFDTAYSAYTDIINHLTSFNQASGDKSARDIYTAEQSTMSGMIFALGLALLLSFGCGYALINAINRPIARIVGGMQEQLVAANEVAATTAEVGATSKEISATAKELMLTVKGVTAVAEDTAAVASSGQTSLARMKSTMQQIVEASGSINSKLGILSEKAGSIGTVITTITKVADQTNLLSLNAAIEAEKAGEYGRGFSVVATEIRRLADQTALATTDIAQMVKEIQSAVSAGVMGMDKFSAEVMRGVDMVQHVSDELTQIIQQVQNLTGSFETVSEGMQSQAIGAQQISEALTQLTEASRQTVDSLRQSNSAIEQLNSTSRTMRQGVARFTLAG